MPPRQKPLGKKTSGRPPQEAWHDSSLDWCSRWWLEITEDRWRRARQVAEVLDPCRVVSEVLEHRLREGVGPDAHPALRFKGEAEVLRSCADTNEAFAGLRVLDWLEPRSYMEVSAIALAVDDEASLACGAAFCGYSGMPLTAVVPSSPASIA